MGCGDEPVVLPGTVRARQPEETWQALAGRLPDWGITRVAKLTGLDCIGLPVWTAIRPASLTLSTAQGKGATDLLARLSAVAEAIELWHVEQPLPIAERGTAADLTPGYPVSALPVTGPHTERTLARMVWDWTTGTTLLGGQKRLVPADLVRRRAQRPEFSPDLLRATSTGLAAGNTRNEAMLHAMFEIIERDVLHRDERSGGRTRTWVDLATVDDPWVREVIDRLTAAGMTVELALVRGPYGLPVCLAYLWSEDYPVHFGGGGCHSCPAIAASRALTEAAQSRATAIAGTRDDLPSDEGPFQAPPFRPARTAGLAPWPRAVTHFGAPGTGLAAQTREVARRIERVTGHELIVLDLSDPAAPLTAVQVLAPGTRSRQGAMPR